MLWFRVFGVFRVFRVFRVCGSGVWVFRSTIFGEDQKGDQGGGPKMAKISGGVKPGYLQEGGPKMAKIEYGVKPDIFKITPVSYAFDLRQIAFSLDVVSWLGAAVAVAVLLSLSQDYPAD